MLVHGAIARIAGPLQVAPQPHQECLGVSATGCRALTSEMVAEIVESQCAKENSQRVSLLEPAVMEYNGKSSR